jgi:hypothetical protein
MESLKIENPDKNTKMNLYIPSYDRANIRDAQIFKWWPAHLHAFVVVRPEEEEKYQKFIQEVVKKECFTILTIGDVGLQPTLNNCIEHANEHDVPRIAVIDDDIGFLIRRDDHTWKLRTSKDVEVIQMFAEMNEKLDLYAHVGISGREGNNRVEGNYALNTRMMRLVGLNLDVLNKYNIRYRLQNRLDFDMNLQLLRLGYENYVFYKYAQGQKDSNAPGGMHDLPERKPDEMKQNALLLEQMHPGFVTAVMKKTKTDWGSGGERWDVRIQWKKALESAGKKIPGIE